MKNTLGEPKKIIGSKPLLFERLVDLEPDKIAEFEKVLTFEEVLESVALEVSRILNTRRSSKKDMYAELISDEDNFGLPIMFGVPDFTSFDPTDKRQRWQISINCERAIRYFEPRLKNVKVSVKDFSKIRQELFLEISGLLTVNKVQKSVNFDIFVDSKSG